MIDPNCGSVCCGLRQSVSKISFLFVCPVPPGKMPKEHIATVDTHAKPSCMHGEKYPFRKLLRRPNMTPSLVENTLFPQTCISNPLLHVWGLISSFLVSVAGRLLAQHTQTHTHTHTHAGLVHITVKCRLEHMCPSLLCVLTWTEDGRLIWFRETRRGGEKQSDQRSEGGRAGGHAPSLTW